MYLWGIRVTTYLTNTLVLIGYALLLNWLQDTKASMFQDHRFREASQLGLTAAFILLFHFASMFSIWQEHNAVGYGWTYITFQIATVMYALLLSRQRSMFCGLAAILLVWYWWLPHVPNWLPWYLITLVLMIVAQRFGDWIVARPWAYYPFCMIFAVPFLYVNLVSLDGIDVGWPWEIGTFISICIWLGLVHYLLGRQREQQAQLREEARIDELTGLNNFRVFNEDLLAAYQQAKAQKSYFAVYTLDIDHFKQVNDQYGHLIGNNVLERVAKTLRLIAADLPYAGVRCYRTGGEEFSFILPKITPDCNDAKNIAWRVHDELGKLRFNAEDGREFQISVSLGETRSLLDDQNYLDIYRRADQYLYKSKNSGRDTITINGTTLPQRQS
ncbi:GGDEF domain-containing protein [Lacticaseibacillus sp. GG6-2]